jgi:hypothetical protein
MKKQIFVFFGDKDWMDKERTSKKINELNLDIEVDIIKNCEHQINFQQPLYTAKFIVLNRDSSSVLNDLDTPEQMNYIKKRDQNGFNEKDYLILKEDKNNIFGKRMKIFKF